MGMCDHLAMKKKTTGGRKSTGQGSGRHSGAKPGKSTNAGGRPKSTAPRPAWMPEPPPRAGRAAPAYKSAGPARKPSRAPARGGTPTGGVDPGTFIDPHADREASRYEQPIASRELILRILGEGPLSADALAQRLDLAAPDRLEALNKRLAAMLRDGQLLLNRRGEFAPTERLDLIAGTVIANPEGFGFLRTDTGGDDLFLPPFEMRKAMHGDRVLASVTGIDRRGRREGAIVEVLERRINRLIGRFEI